jgi:histidinol phosphatase-like enzyme
MNNNDEPYIFLLDLDGTIIGDCSYQCDIYNIQEIIKKNIILKKPTVSTRLVNKTIISIKSQ